MTKLVRWHEFFIHHHNPPLKRPGAYKLTNIKTNRSYIGICKDVRSRAFNHMKGKRNPTKWSGPENFLFEPLYYQLSGPLTDLKEVEVGLILGWDTLRPNGYNKEIYGSGPTESICEKNSRATTEHNHDPEYRDRINQGLRSPQSRERKSKRSLFSQNDPVVKAARQPIVLETNRRPERRAKIAKSRLGKMWITNGEINLSVPSTSELPEGFHRGKTHHKTLPPSFGEKQRTNKLGTIWITNGLVSKQHRGEIPEGWRRGKQPKM